MLSITDLPSLNALLNLSSGLCLVFAYRFIKRKNVRAHKRMMLAAFSLSVLFLISYLVYHYSHGSQAFQGTGWIRPVYFVILVTHTVLATAVVPMAIVTLVRGLRGKYALHKKIARWTFPVWLYVSVTGVVIFLMLYRLYPGP